jgi:hypothetical protein
MRMGMRAFIVVVVFVALLPVQRSARAVIVVQLPDGRVSAYRQDVTARTWTDAQLYAASLQYAGVPGHLATVIGWDD